MHLKHQRQIPKGIAELEKLILLALSRVPDEYEPSMPSKKELTGKLPPGMGNMNMLQNL
jgi:hypothetical protein